MLGSGTRETGSPKRERFESDGVEWDQAARSCIGLAPPNRERTLLEVDLTPPKPANLILPHRCIQGDYGSGMTS